MANILDILKKKTKSNSLSTNGVEPVKYNNPIARLNPSSVSLRDPNYSSNSNSTTNNGKATTLPKAQ